MTKIVTIIKSLTAKKVFQKCPQVRKSLWGGEFWTDGYFASTVSKHGDEKMISEYVKNQGLVYKQLHEDRQLKLFSYPAACGGVVHFASLKMTCFPYFKTTLRNIHRYLARKGNGYS